MSDDVDAFIARVTPAKRQRDAEVLLELYGRVTGLEPELWGSIVGYGGYHYRYATGREGDTPAAAFAPRKAATSIYLMDGVGTHHELLGRLGPYSSGVGCLYLRDLTINDLGVLEQIVTASFRALTAGTFTDRAREHHN
ncbi:DUF1801 domain-containing protein [Gryllotalpicola protaetiae]|uniref:DUF1801 domain-containing protein n=1 Tax=Gryllotalpicola protaetiae TaxID=2419771 RepID=UPI0015E8BE0D|nr:DUF1801 domain-containing protein [Gryllotalpicola protaetiae]